MFKSIFEWLLNIHAVSNWLLLIVLLCLTASIAFAVKGREKQWPQK